MAYSDFTLAKARDAFGLTLDETRNLFQTVAEVQPSELLRRLLDVVSTQAVLQGFSVAVDELLA